MKDETMKFVRVENIPGGQRALMLGKYGDEFWSLNDLHTRISNLDGREDLTETRKALHALVAPY